MADQLYGLTGADVQRLKRLLDAFENGQLNQRPRYRRKPLHWMGSQQGTNLVETAATVGSPNGIDASTNAIASGSMKIQNLSPSNTLTDDTAAESVRWLSSWTAEPECKAMTFTANGTTYAVPLWMTGAGESYGVTKPIAVVTADTMTVTTTGQPLDHSETYVLNDNGVADVTSGALRIKKRGWYLWSFSGYLDPLGVTVPNSISFSGGVNLFPVSLHASVYGRLSFTHCGIVGTTAANQTYQWTSVGCSADSYSLVGTRLIIIPLFA